NATEQAAVYQDLSTTPGTVIYWSFYQGGVWYSSSQNINNTMAVRIGRPDQLTNETMVSDTATVYDQSWSNRIIYNIDSMVVASSIPAAYSGKDGYKTQLYTEPKRWTKYEGVYVVPEGQTVTRMAFASLSEIANQGNLFEGVVFRIATQEEFDSLSGTNIDQSAPTGFSGVTPTSASSNGKITGTTTAMEYKLASADDSTYAACSNTETEVAAGDYVVRLAAKIGFNASPTTAVTVSAYVAPITPTPTPATPSTPSTNNTSSKNSGLISKDEQQDESVPATNVNNSTEELKSAVFTKEELTKINAGEDAKVILKVKDINESVSEEEKKLIEQNLEEGTSLMYIDLSLYKKVGNGAETKLTETNGEISISIEIPEELRSTDMAKDRNYKIVRIHDGVVTVIEGTYDPATFLFTFKTDQFSTYALAYEDTNADTKTNVKNSAVASTNDFYHFCLTSKASETSQKLTYNKVSGADGYIIYGSPCGINIKMAKLADVSNKITTYDHVGLKNATFYKYYVQAYKLVSGKKVVIATSKIIHSITTSDTYSNPTKVVSDISVIAMKAGASKQLTCNIVLPDGKITENHISEIRYETTNKKIATVSESGSIKAMSKGTCYIYAYAQNGVYTKIKVTVK
ncbi:MAG: hypothetical protein HGA25_07465, partial [Clostridiales bacterium]|nr:hypothetical protein [Clostridiales bacterium]